MLLLTDGLQMSSNAEDREQPTIQNWGISFSWLQHSGPIAAVKCPRQDSNPRLCALEAHPLTTRARRPILSHSTRNRFRLSLTATMATSTLAADELNPDLKLADLGKYEIHSPDPLEGRLLIWSFHGIHHLARAVPTKDMIMTTVAIKKAHLVFIS